MTDQSTPQNSLSAEAANALLKAITDLAPRVTGPEGLKHLGDAYAAVRGAMPTKRSAPRKS